MEKQQFSAIAKSGQRSFSCEIELFAMTPQECTEFENKQLFCELCQTGCKNFSQKWSCPPHSPTFSAIAHTWSHLYVVYIRAPMAPFGNIKNKYLQIKAANSMLKSRADKFVRHLAAQHHGRYISTGSCRLCKPCKIKMNTPCAHPDLMAYSFEALGIDVSALVDHCFTTPLLWYKDGCVPMYSSVVCGLLSNQKVKLEKWQEIYTTVIVD